MKERKETKGKRQKKCFWKQVKRFLLFVWYHKLPQIRIRPVSQKCKQCSRFNLHHNSRIWNTWITWVINGGTTEEKFKKKKSGAVSSPELWWPQTNLIFCMFRALMCPCISCNCAQFVIIFPLGKRSALNTKKKMVTIATWKLFRKVWVFSSSLNFFH